MTSRIGNTYRISVGKNGHSVLVQVIKKRCDVSTELKRKGRTSVRVVSRREASVFAAPVALPRRGGAS